MKKITSLIIIFTLIMLFFSTQNVYAATLDELTVDLSKQIAKPGDEVKLSINFGKSLGAYTFNIAYDSNIFEYVSTEGGTPNNTSDKVVVTFYDSTGGSSPRENMNVIFKAKSEITTSNPTEFLVSAEGLANSDATVVYDDITTPIVKNITVEPEYEDYSISLTHKGAILVNEPKEMTLSYKSAMGKYYEHARLVAEAESPEGANVSLTAIDGETQAKQDIIQSGWGEAQGYKIGGKDVSQVLNVSALFTEKGNYTITLKLIDRDDSDTIIAQNKFVYSIPTNTLPTEKDEPKEEVIEDEKKDEVKEDTINKDNKPSKLPKTGYGDILPILALGCAFVALILYCNKKSNK